MGTSVRTATPLATALGEKKAQISFHPHGANVCITRRRDSVDEIKPSPASLRHIDLHSPVMMTNTERLWQTRRKH
ncbi:hypothetical protein BgiBS90_024098, partial [Biomphalaria glabrata]